MVKKRTNKTKTALKRAPLFIGVVVVILGLVAALAMTLFGNFDLRQKAYVAPYTSQVNCLRTQINNAGTCGGPIGSGRCTNACKCGYPCPSPSPSPVVNAPTGGTNTAYNVTCTSIGLNFSGSATCNVMSGGVPFSPNSVWFAIYDDQTRQLLSTGYVANGVTANISYPGVSNPAKRYIIQCHAATSTRGACDATSYFNR